MKSGKIVKTAHHSYLRRIKKAAEISAGAVIGAAIPVSLRAFARLRRQDPAAEAWLRLKK